MAALLVNNSNSDSDPQIIFHTQLKACMHLTISLISDSSKVMLKVILNRLKPQAEEIIAEEHAGFRAGRNTTAQVFNLRILCEKYLRHQQNLYHVFIDFQKSLYII